MLESELKKIWQGSSQEELIKFNKSKLLIELDLKLNYLDSKIKNRDRMEFITAYIVIAALGFGIYYFPGIISKLGLALTILYAITVIFMLKNVKKYKVENYSLPIKEYLNNHRKYLIKERNLIDNILYWYLLPPSICAIIFFIGLDLESTRFIINLIVILAINIFIYLLNKRAVKKDFDPIIKKLDIAINDLELKEK